MVRFGSLCSGIEAPSVAWKELGWEPCFYSEIEPFASAVLAQRHPETPNLGDMTELKGDDLRAAELLVAGTPCQSFSVAGDRGGMDDERGRLALDLLRLLDEARPRWLVWENVPGVLSSNGGRDFGAFLGGLAECGYGFAYRVLDARHFGVPQRRRRVFVVGYLGDWRRPAAVLLERESLLGHPEPRRKTGTIATGPLTASLGGSGADASHAEAGHLVARCLLARGGSGRYDADTETLIPAAAAFNWQNGGGSENANDGLGFSPEVFSPILRKSYPAVCFDPVQITSKENRSNPKPGDPAPTLPAEGKAPVLAHNAVRRLTPRECERLQGFPDDYTRIDWAGKGPARCPDGRRIKALGNSIAVPVLRWIGERIAFVESLPKKDSA